ncbi:MAG: hypothetical protein KBS62_00990 [Oscillospiraceae bacterium]|nr:hypothetical protein [Candidatus Ruminococcus equi]
MGRTKQTEEERQASIERRRARQRDYWHKKHPNARHYKDNGGERESNHELLNYIQRRLKECGGTMTIIDIAREYYYENKR